VKKEDFCSTESKGAQVFVQDRKLQSEKWDTSINVTFQNRSDLKLEYWWQNYSGEEVFYQRSAGNDKRNQ
jgi:hypothetical protein